MEGISQKQVDKGFLWLDERIFFANRIYPDREIKEGEAIYLKFMFHGNTTAEMSLQNGLFYQANFRMFRVGLMGNNIMPNYFIQDGEFISPKTGMSGTYRLKADTWNSMVLVKRKGTRLSSEYGTQITRMTWLKLQSTQLSKGWSDLHGNFT